MSQITEEIIRVLENQQPPKPLPANAVYAAGAFEAIQPVYVALATMAKDKRLLRTAPANGGKYVYAINPAWKGNGEKQSISTEESRQGIDLQGNYRKESVSDHTSRLVDAIVAGVKHEPVKPTSDRHIVMPSFTERSDPQDDDTVTGVVSVKVKPITAKLAPFTAPERAALGLAPAVSTPIKPITADAARMPDKEIGGHATVSPPTDPRPASASAVTTSPQSKLLRLIEEERDELVRRIKVLDARITVLAEWARQDGERKYDEGILRE